MLLLFTNALVEIEVVKSMHPIESKLALEMLDFRCLNFILSEFIDKVGLE